VSNDVGRIAVDGSLTILGRSDDVVVTGGLNVSLTEVADAIDGIEGVASSVVVGLPDDEWGTAIAAVVDTEVTIDQVRTGLAGVLAPHQIPRRWRIGEIPLLANGKPDLVGVRRSFLDN
jgi:o-succinylbenzoate---CoA ligase